MAEIKPDVDRDRFVPADALELLLLQQPQHLALRGGRHVADFVEKNRAAVALLEPADVPAVGAGEGPLLVAEQLAFQQRVGQGRAVDRHEAVARDGGCAGRGPARSVPCPSRSRRG